MRENGMDNAVVLYMRKPNALVRNRKTYITPERDVVPLYRSGRPMLPVKFFAGSIGAQVEEAAKQALPSLTLRKGEQAYPLAGCTWIGGEVYAPAEELCRAFGLYLFYDEADLLIYSEENLDLSWDKDLARLRKIAESFIYDDVTGAEITARIKEKHPECGHPRMLVTAEKFAQIRRELAKGETGDPVIRSCMQAIGEQADQYLTQKPAFYEIRDGIRLLDVSREVLDRVMYLAIVYQVTLEEKYAVRARQELIAACSFQDWHPYHFLDVGELAAAAAFGYDWLYDWLDEGDRQLIRRAIVENAFDPILEDYDDLPRERTWRWREKPVCNWRFVAGGGTACGAIAIADELEGADLEKAERVLEQSLLDIREAISLFAPDGGYEEGLGYWDYACKYYMFHVGSLKTATGSDFGYLDAPGLRHTADFVVAMNGPASKMGFHDAADSRKHRSPLLMFWAKVFGENPYLEHAKAYYAYARPALEQIAERGGNLLELLCYDPVLMQEPEQSPEEGTALQPPLDSIRKAVGVFTARSGYDRDALWVGFHVDDAYAGPSHDHMDVGSFVLDAMGENFFSDLGSDDYNIPNYYRDVYVFRAEGHNVFVINPDAGYDQRFGGKASFSEWAVNGEEAYAAADLTDIYADHVISARRCIRLGDQRRAVTVQDEIVMKQPSEFYWFAHTFAQIRVSEDGRKAYLTRNGKTLLAEILTGEGAVFSVMEAKPLPTSPNPPGQKSTAGASKLTIHMTECSEVKLTVAFRACESSGSV